MAPPHFSPSDALSLASWIGFCGFIIIAVWHKVKNYLAKVDPTSPKPPPYTDLALQLSCVCTELRTETRADRVQIHLFHNGEHYKVNNASIQRFSCVTESVKSGVASAVEHYSRCLISAYIDGLAPIVTKEGSQRLDIDELPDCLYKTTMMVTDSAVHVGSRLVWNGDVVGFVLLSFRDENRPQFQCLFNMLVDVGTELDSDTQEMRPRTCVGECPDCRLTQEYVPRIEYMLSQSDGILDMGYGGAK